MTGEDASVVLFCRLSVQVSVHGGCWERRGGVAHTASQSEHEMNRQCMMGRSGLKN